MEIIAITVGIVGIIILLFVGILRISKEEVPNFFQNEKHDPLDILFLDFIRSKTRSKTKSKNKT